MKHLLLLLLLPLSLCCAEDYYDQLRKLTSGRQAIPAKLQGELEKTANSDIRKGVAGIAFGMSMQQVIDIYGFPRSVNFQLEDVVQLGIYHSTFIFKGDRLQAMMFHQIDLPHLRLMDGRVAMGPGSGAALKDRFPEATYRNEFTVRHVLEFEDGSKLSVQEHDGSIIAIGCEAPR